MKHKLQKLVWAAACTLCAAAGRAEGLLADWPALPLLSIETEGGEFPTCSVVMPPEGCVGTGITDAEYVKGHLVMTLCGDTLLDTGPYVEDESGMRIKVRGNSSGTSMFQKPYKVKLSRKFDMLCRGGDDYREKDWNLLMINTGNPGLASGQSNILNVLGFAVSRTVGMEWTPGWTLVNVVMNGRYMGMYYLTDAVERGDRRVDIDKTGYLVENDAYWWNEDVSFKTPHQPYAMGYTFKYPDADDVDEATTERIRGYLTCFEEALYAGGDVAEWIDVDSWARWILAHDILASGDDAGSNMYIYKDDFDEEAPTASKLKMGPLWDFDSAFRDVADRNAWSALHEGTFFYFPQLFLHPCFVEAYRAAWSEVRPVLADSVAAAFGELSRTYGEAYAQSMELHRALYPHEGVKDLPTQIAELTELVEQRIAVLDSLVDGMSTVGAGAGVVAVGAAPVRFYDLTGRACGAESEDELPPGIYVRVGADGTSEKLLKR